MALPPPPTSKPLVPALPENKTQLSVDLKNITFKYPKAKQPTLRDLTLQLPETGARCLLIGANGSGKSTLLRVLAGKHLVKDLSQGGDPFDDGHVKVCGLDAYRDSLLNFHRSHLDCDWGLRTTGFAGVSPLQADMLVCDMMKKLQAD